MLETLEINRIHRILDNNCKSYLMLLEHSSRNRAQVARKLEQFNYIMDKDSTLEDICKTMVLALALEIMPGWGIEPTIRDLHHVLNINKKLTIVT